MTKRNILIGVGCLVAVGGIVAAIVLWPSNKVDYGAASTNVATATATDSTSPSSLSVSTQATDLGQINPNQTQKQAAAGSAGSSGSSDPVDPSTFKQYDKYKTAKSALFADISTGNGTSLTANKKAIVIYKGWLTDGTIFDQSHKGSDGKIQAFSFTEGAHQVIPGWEQAMYGMKSGGIRLLIVPPAVGYGAQGQGPVPPNAVLIFEVQLVSVQ